MQSVRHAGKLTGEVAGDIVDGSRKAELLQAGREELRAVSMSYELPSVIRLAQQVRRPRPLLRWRVARLKRTSPSYRLRNPANRRMVTSI